MEDIVDISSCRCWLHYCLLVYVLALQCALNIHCVLKAAFSGCKNTADVEQQRNTTAKQQNREVEVVLSEHLHIVLN